MTRELNHTWKTIWVTIVWSIWTHRNNIVFKGSIQDSDDIFNVSQLKTWVWITNKFPKAHFSYFDWCLYLGLCIKSYAS
ncbi:hypothetical protein PHAVU_003G045100 [Phaseolus vulgaris]|uniref:Reverse transcriptase zinc-binding domain-containing protein n=1 Tax=Phaseolus vulgaris TaxID=3885 RepID=V7C8D5_PHAVU|nr:hypothetical protein PHAVU_003G045100g [Phaseolus vulgaris]ESW25545.1 hypothetical protein PHAVU_003G045100g [Phaseolus vulgaris]